MYTVTSRMHKGPCTNRPWCNGATFFMVISEHPVDEPLTPNYYPCTQLPGKLQYMTVDTLLEPDGGNDTPVGLAKRIQFSARRGEVFGHTNSLAHHAHIVKGPCKRIMVYIDITVEQQERYWKGAEDVKEYPVRFLEREDDVDRYAQYMDLPSHVEGFKWASLGRYLEVKRQYTMHTLYTAQRAVEAKFKKVLNESADNVGTDNFGFVENEEDGGNTDGQEDDEEDAQMNDL